jgi:transcriptional regulator with XRE-family HTH domain
MKTSLARVQKNLKNLLQIQGKSMDRAGLESNVSKATISRILSGKLNPTVGTLHKLAEYFEVDIQRFFDP